MATLSTDQLNTLRNLADKKAGVDVGWVTIAIAQELTELGLATRTRSGWEITPAGEDALKRAGAGGSPRLKGTLSLFQAMQPATS